MASMPPGSAAGLTVDTVTGNASRHSGSSVGSNPLTGDAGADDSASANSVLSTTPLGSPLGSPQTRDAPSLSLDELFALATTPRPSRPQSRISTPVVPPSRDTDGAARICGATAADDAAIRELLSELRRQDAKLEQAGRLGIELHAHNEALVLDYDRLRDDYRALVTKSETSRESTLPTRSAEEIEDLDRSTADATLSDLETLLGRSRAANKALDLRNKSLNTHCAEADNRIEQLDAQLRDLTLKLRQTERRLDRARKEHDAQRLSLEESERQREDSRRELQLLRQKSAPPGGLSPFSATSPGGAPREGLLTGAASRADVTLVSEPSTTSRPGRGGTHAQIVIEAEAADAAKFSRLEREITALRSTVLRLEEELDLSKDRVRVLKGEVGGDRLNGGFSTPSSPIVRDRRVLSVGSDREQAAAASLARGGSRSSSSSPRRASSATSPLVATSLPSSSSGSNDNDGGSSGRIDLEARLHQAQHDLTRESSIRVRLDSEVRVYQQLCDRHDAEQRSLRLKLRETEARLNRVQNEARVSQVRLRQLEISSADELAQEVHSLRTAASVRETRVQQAEEQLLRRLQEAEDAKEEADSRALGFQNAAMAVMKKLAALEREREGEEAREKAEAEAAATGGRDGGRAYLQQWRGDKSSPAAVQLRILEELYSSASTRVQKLRPPKGQ